MQHFVGLLAVAAALALTATGSHAAVTISSAATQNMSCSGGTCAPTAKSAVLNVRDLENLLASGNATVTTTGSGVQADDIHVNGALAWSSPNTLALEAHRSIAVKASVSVTGQSGLTLDTGKNGTLSFGTKGYVNFANLSSQLMINGSAFTLAGDVKTLAADIAANPGGDFALANSYDASGDGTYTSPPVSTVLTGIFDGLGNTISHLSVSGPAEIETVLYEGLFAELGTERTPDATIRNIGLVAADIVGSTSVKNVSIGSLVGTNWGTVLSSYATGEVKNGKSSWVGGLVGDNGGTIARSHSAAVVIGGHIFAGGLVGINGATISDSYATGKITMGGGGKYENEAGGLVGFNNGTIQTSYATGNVVGGSAFLNGGVVVGGLIGGSDGSIISSYATGAVSGGMNSWGGGLAGLNGGGGGTISFSYSIGTVVGGSGSFVGGFVGYDAASAGSLNDTYWDTDTSGITDPSQGAGNIANDPGITGLTTAQFQSGLPTGFDPMVWAENANINGGLPYLLDNPPPK